MLVPGILILVLLAALAVTVTVIALAGRRRAEQGTLLWLLAVGVEKRLPLDREIDALAQAARGTRRWRMLQLADDLRRGDPLADALHRQKGLVPRSAALAAQVGAVNGTLATALRDAAVRFTTPAVRLNLGASSAAAVLAYLWLLITAGTLVVGFIAYYIIPKFKRIFEDFGLVELPYATQLMIEASDVFVVYFYLFSPILNLFPVALVLLIIGYIVGWGEFDYPFIGRWLTRFDTPNLLRNLAQAVAARRPLEQSLATIQAGHRRQNVRVKVRQALETIEQGQETWPALEQAGFLRRHEGDLLCAAERAGNLPWALRELADVLERRWFYRLAATVDLVQPAVVFAIGAVVCLICLGIFLPLVKLLTDLV